MGISKHAARQKALEKIVVCGGSLFTENLKGGYGLKGIGLLSENTYHFQARRDKMRHSIKAKIFAFSVAFLLIISVPFIGFAADYPNRPVKIIIPWGV